MGQISFEVPGPGTYSITADPTLPVLSNPGAAGDALNGKQFYTASNTTVTGTIPINEPQNITIEGGGSYVIPQGYHYGTGMVTSEGATLPTLSNPGIAADLLTGTQLIDQEGNVVQGSMPNNADVVESLAAGASYTIPLGYHNGNGTVTANTLSSQTQGTATAQDILEGETAWVNGQQITGTATPSSIAADATATAQTILSPYTAYVASGKVTGTIQTNTSDNVTINANEVSVESGYYGEQVSVSIPTATQAVPSITVSESGLITATATQESGYVEQGTQNATQQLSTKGAQTIVPSTADQTIASGIYTTGTQTIQGDANLLPTNIKDGISIFGVLGTYTGDTGSFSAPIVVTVASGSTVTAQNGQTTLSAVSDGTVTFIVTEPGDWTISASLNGQVTSSETVTVYQSYPITLNFMPNYYQTLGLSVPRANLAAATISGYALFAGGETASSPYTSAVVDAFDTSLALTQPTPLSVSRKNLAGAANQNYALFGGGESSNTNYSTVDAYDATLTLTNPTQLSQACNTLASSPVGDYVLFAGGMIDDSSSTYVYSDSVDAYSSTLVKTQAQPLVLGRSNLASASNNGYAVFAGGQTNGSTVVEAYDELLSKATPQALSQALRDLAGGFVGEYVLFAGGFYQSGSTYYSTRTVTAYDSTLTKVSCPSLSYARGLLSSTTLNGYAMFGGGRDGLSITQNDAYKYVDAYSTTLTLTSPQSLSTPRTNLAATTIQQYALFGGGGLGARQGVDDESYVVDVYTV